MPFESLTLPVDSPAAQVLGTQPLQAENSTHASVGVALTPVPGLDITVDSIRRKQRALLHERDRYTYERRRRDRQRVSLADGGDVRLFASFNNTRTTIVGAIATPPQLVGFEQTVSDRIERRRIECGQPRRQRPCGR